MRKQHASTFCAVGGTPYLTSAISRVEVCTREIEALSSRLEVRTCIKMDCLVIRDFDDIAAWKPVIGVAAVACSDLSNAALCRNYGISGFPSVKVNITSVCGHQMCFALLPLK